MQRRRSIAVAASAVVVLGLSCGAAVVSATGDDGPGTPISGRELDRATAAALAATGGGRVTGTEVGDEESYYEVEVTHDDGSQVDVQLDEAFHLVTVIDDHEGAGGTAGRD